MVFAPSVLSGVGCQGVLSVTILCLRRCSVYIGLVRQAKWGLGAYLRCQNSLGFLIMVVFCVKGIKEEIWYKSVASLELP